MKNLSRKVRATVICARHDRVLLVSKDNVRWELPGGRPGRPESPLDAAQRELMEETALRPKSITFLFQFVGATTVHHVFDAQVGSKAEAVPCNEIRECRWLTQDELARATVSPTTREIVKTYFASSMPQA